MRMNLPNYITLLRVILIPFFIGFMVYGYNREALLVFVSACITDALDGSIARLMNQKTELGAFLDPMADKLLILSAFVTLVLLEIARLARYHSGKQGCHPDDGKLDHLFHDRQPADPAVHHRKIDNRDAVGSCDRFADIRLFHGRSRVPARSALDHRRRYHRFGRSVFCQGVETGRVTPRL